MAAPGTKFAVYDCLVSILFSLCVKIDRNGGFRLRDASKRMEEHTGAYFNITHALKQLSATQIHCHHNDDNDDSSVMIICKLRR